MAPLNVLCQARAPARRWCAGVSPLATASAPAAGLGRLRAGISSTQSLLASGRQQLARWACRATGSGRDGEARGTTTQFAGGLDPALEAAVPREQRPSQELLQVKTSNLYSWGCLELNDYVMRLVGVYAFFFALVGGPIAYQTFDPLSQPLEWFLSGSTGSMLVVAAVVLRVYLGWSYVGDRLLSAAVAYEETGWYDGQTFVKPPEVLARDRLLGLYEVKPVLRKLRATLIGTGGLLLVVAVLLFGLIKAGSDVDGMYGRSAGRPTVQKVTPDGIIYSSRVKDINQLKYDDELAAAEAAAAGDRPGYCGDRYFKAVAGGQYCD